MTRTSVCFNSFMKVTLCVSRFEDVKRVPIHWKCSFNKVILKMQYRLSFHSVKVRISFLVHESFELTFLSYYFCHYVRSIQIYVRVSLRRISIESSFTGSKVFCASLRNLTIAESIFSKYIYHIHLRKNFIGRPPLLHHKIPDFAATWEVQGGPSKS